MFIPMWLLVVIVVAVILTIPAVRELLGTLLLLATILVVTASALGALYFLFTKQTTLALISGAPFLAVMAWFALTESVKVWDSSGKLNTSALAAYIALGRRSAGSPEAIQQARYKLAERAQLGYRLFRFYDTIKYFSSWYVRKAEKADFWEGSRVIAHSDLPPLSNDDREQLGLKVSKRVREDSLTYRFSSGGQTFLFVAERADVPSWHDEDDGHYQARQFYVFEELPRTTVLKMLVVYKSDEYADSYSDMHLEAFRPGPWLSALLGVVDRVRVESDQRAEVMRKRMDETRVRENFL